MWKMQESHFRNYFDNEFIITTSEQENFTLKFNHIKRNLDSFPFGHFRVVHSRVQHWESEQWQIDQNGSINPLQ